MRRASYKVVALLLAALPLLGAPCTNEKVVDIVIGFPTTVLLEASGSTNVVTFQSANFNIKQDVDVQGALDDADIDVFAIGKDPLTRTCDVQVAQVFYRVINPDVVGNRQIVNASLRVGRVDQATGQVIGGATGSILISGWNGNAGVANVADRTAWIEVTPLLGSGGLQLLNDYMYDLICCLQDGIPMPNPDVRYAYSGTSSPTGQTTFFEYEVKVVFQGKFPQSFEVPFG